MHYFLAKTDPETYSISDLEREKKTIWDGVHSYQAVAVIRLWKPGDLVFVYHSQKEKRIVGCMEVLGLPYKDEHDERGMSWVAEVGFKERYPVEKQVTLAEIKQSGKFADFALVKQSRLSTMACPTTFVTWMKEKLV